MKRPSQTDSERSHDVEGDEAEASDSDTVVRTDQLPNVVDRIWREWPGLIAVSRMVGGVPGRQDYLIYQ